MLYGIGINDADYRVRPRKGPACPFYVRWSNMLKRCYTGQYNGVTVCKEWHTSQAYVTAKEARVAQLMETTQ
jgi:hypothetical protein